jgi:hypothetical protein
MIEKRGRGQPKFEPTQDQRNQVKLMKALGIPEERLGKTITNPRTKKPVAPMTLARAFAPEFESGATKFHAVTAPLDPETKRLRRLAPGALADEALALKKRIDAIKDEAIRRRLKTAEGEAGRITLSPPGSQDLTERELLLKVLNITEPEFIARFTRTRDRGRLSRARHKACYGAEPMVRIHLPPVASL